MAKATLVLPAAGTKITRADLEKDHGVTDIVNADISATAAIDERKLALNFPSHAEAHNHDGVYEPAGVDWVDVTGKPLTFPPDAHNHSGVYEPAGTVATHEAALDPHPGYLTAAAGNAAYEAAGAVSTHAGALDPHTGYVLESAHTKASHDALLIDAATLDGVDSTGFAVAAKGVTNGDTHDHSGGDGAQIAYSSLSGLPTIPAPASLGETADSTTGAESDGISPRYAKADHVHHYEAGVPGAHAASHQNGGGDEISVSGLSGLLADAQTPAAHASAHQPGGGDAMAVDAVAGTGSLRTLGAGAQQAAAGNHTHAGGSVPLISYPICTALVGNQVWTNMPAALSFWFATATACKSVRRIDLTNYLQVRLRVVKLGTAGAAASKLILRYKASPWTQTVANYSDIGATEVSVAINVQNSFLDTGWINLAAGAKADVFVALLGSGGDGVLDPIFGEIVAEFQ